MGFYISLPGVEPALSSWKVGVATASPPSRTEFIEFIHKDIISVLKLIGLNDLINLFLIAFDKAALEKVLKYNLFSNLILFVCLFITDCRYERNDILIKIV